jgi:hypothetical protein
MPEVDLELSLSDSTAVFKEVKFKIAGLPIGNYCVRRGGCARARRFFDSSEIALLLPSMQSCSESKHMVRRERLARAGLENSPAEISKQFIIS